MFIRSCLSFSVSISVLVLLSSFGEIIGSWIASVCILRIQNAAIRKKMSVCVCGVLES